MLQRDLTASEAAQKLLYRRAVRRSLTAWGKHCGYTPALHHQLLIRVCEQVVQAVRDGRQMNVAIAGPPGMAKTTWVSHLFASHFMATFPDKQLLSGSHSQDFAERQIGSKVRELIERNASTLGIRISPTSGAMHDFQLITGGQYRAAGVGKGIAGFRADLGLIEDPFPKWSVAQDLWKQEEVWNWYRGDFVPRLKPNAPRFIIHTRFNEQDLIGKVIERDRTLGIDWTYIKIPMIAGINDPLGREPGERLWPEWFTEAQVIEAQADDAMFQAMYQQDPISISGSYFKDEWFIDVSKVGGYPPLRSMSIYGASDYAVKEDDASDPDYTVHGLLGVDSEERHYLLDVWRDKTTSDKWVDAQLDLVLKYKPLSWAEETGQIKLGIAPWRNKEAIRRRAHCDFQTFPTHQGKKEIRCQPFRALAASRKIYVDKRAKWWPDFRSEILRLWNCPHDDQGDMLGLMGQLIENMVKPQRPKSEKQKHLDDYRGHDDDLIEEGTYGSSLHAL